MTQPAPSKQFNELIDSMNEMIIHGVNNHLIQEIASAADKMKQYGEYLDSYIISGMIAAIRGNALETDRLFNAAINCGGRAPNTLCNYASALNNLGRYRSAIKVIDELVNIAPDDLSVVKTALKVHRDAFDINGVNDLKKRCEMLGDPIVDLEVDNNLMLVDELLTSHKVNWEDLASRTELAYSVLHKLGLHMCGRNETLQDGIFLFDFRIDADVNAVFLGESAINDAIAEKPYSPVDNFLYLTCSVI